MTTSTETTFRSHDGLRPVGTLVTPNEQQERAIVLVHGGGVTRQEPATSVGLADGLALAGWPA